MWILGLLTLVVVAGCSKAAPTSDQSELEIPVVARGDNRVVAEGVVEPARWGAQSAKLGGEVETVNVETGDPVEAGDLLVVVDREALELTFKSAEQDLRAQQAALDLLLNGATDVQIARTDKELGDQIAQAEITLRATELRLQRARLDDPSIDVAAAESRIQQLQAQLSQIRAQDPAAEVAAAQVGLERAQIALDDTQDEYNKALDRPWEDQDIRDAWAKQLEQRQLDQRLARAQLDGARQAQTAHRLGLQVLQAQIAEAETQLDRAQTALEAQPVTLETLSADVDAARAALEALKSTDNPLRDAARAEQVEQARVAVSRAELAVAQLKLQLEDAELRAPFDGIVADVDVKVGDEVTPGQVVLVLATLDQLQVKTTDLTELDVGRIAVGNAVEVSVDALPDETFAGQVTEIGLQGQDYRGDVVYAVVVAFTDAVPKAVRWGMTAMVEVETK
jgi:multidrug efflux pump subunit AcrA (membrane-fusion protein)